MSQLAKMKTDLRDYSKSMAETEITDPLELLKSLSASLNAKGGIASCDDSSKIISQMRSCKKLVGRCTYLSILRVTKDEEILHSFMSDGGWKIMNKWLTDAKDTDNNVVVLEILKFLQYLPVAIQHLKENNTPKIVKHYAKSQIPKLKSAASSLMQSWMAVITGGSLPADTESSKKKKKEKKKVKAEPPPKVAKPESKVSAAPPLIKAPSFAKQRKTGLETEQQLPKKKVKSKVGSGAQKRNSTESDVIPDKKIKQDIKPPKKIMLSEGEGFMDALNSASNPLPIIQKKVKRRPVKPTTTPFSSASSVKVSPTTEVTYGDANDFSATELLRKLSPQQGSTSPVSTEPAKPKLNKYGRPMKTVRFKSEEFLESIRYFEVDENERVNVSTQSFKDAQHREMMIERQLMKGGKVSDDGGNGDWRRPLPIDGLEALVVSGCNSVEKDIQMEREKTVLMSIFLTKEMVPESPMEPDPEPYEILQPKIIPFDDDNTMADTSEVEQETGSSANDVIMKNMLSGMQASDSGELTEKLRQILQNAGIQANTNGDSTQQNVISPEAQMSQPMNWAGEGAPMQVDHNNVVFANGQVQYFGGQPMMVAPDQHMYQQNWNPNPRPMMNRPVFNPNWAAPPAQWQDNRRGPRPRGRNDFRGRNDKWRGRWNDSRRR